MVSVPPPGIEPVPPTVEAWILNHRSTREFPFKLYLFKKLLSLDSSSESGDSTYCLKPHVHFKKKNLSHTEACGLSVLQTGVLTTGHPGNFPGNRLEVGKDSGECP